MSNAMFHYVAKHTHLSSARSAADCALSEALDKDLKKMVTNTKSNEANWKVALAKYQELTSLNSLKKKKKLVGINDLTLGILSNLEKKVYREEFSGDCLRSYWK